MQPYLYEEVLGFFLPHLPVQVSPDHRSGDGRESLRRLEFIDTVGANPADVRFAFATCREWVMGDEF